MSARLKPTELDQILALQLTVAWAGESAGDRLGWWKSDLVDPEGGGDLLARLVPKTAAWAGLILVRDAARAIEHEALKAFHQRDSMWTLFHLGFVIDEQLADRLADHRRSLVPPKKALPEGFQVGGAWSKSEFEASLAALPKPKVEVVPNGRCVRARVASPVEACLLLAAALLPLDKRYPLPFLEAPT